mmetsp:Transcript_2369/g.2738  ORF Transcript_2369/g.2738 Transcript_2369/m.2738 type:complete len:505 (-) Transcript_2369:72-1586(-)
MSDVDENETKTEDVDVDEVIDNVVDNNNDNDNDDDGNDTDTETTNQLGKQWSGDTTTFVEEKRRSVREGAAFDVIMVQDSEGTLYENSDYLVSFKGEKETTGGTITNEDPNKMVVLELLVPTDDLVPGDTISNKVWFQINKGGGTGTGSDNENGNEKDPKQENLQALKMYLHSGRNPMRYLLLNLELKTIVGMASASIFVYSQHDSIVVSDIDGTVTKSNAAGLLGTVGPFKEALYGKVTHEGICHLLSTLASQKHENENETGTTQVVYLTSRPTLLANQTRQFLIDLTQPATTSTTTTTNENTVVDDDNESARTTANKEANDIGLPRGPLLGFGGKVSNVLVMELISHTANEFKSKKLWQQVVQPFREANNNNNNTDSNENDTNHPTFVAGFGNNTRDMQAYHSIGMDLRRIYMIDKKSRIVIFDKKMEDDDKNETDPATTVTTATNNRPTDFQSEQFYKDRIGTTFDEGYTDTKLMFQLGFYDHNEEKKANISKYFGGKMNK